MSRRRSCAHAFVCMRFPRPSPPNNGWLGVRCIARVWTTRGCAGVTVHGFWLVSRSFRTCVSLCTYSLTGCDIDDGAAGAFAQAITASTTVRSVEFVSVGHANLIVEADLPLFTLSRLRSLSYNRVSVAGAAGVLRALSGKKSLDVLMFVQPAVVRAL